MKKSSTPLHSIDTTYAHFFVKGDTPSRGIRNTPVELSDDDKAKVKVHADNLKKYAPEFYSFVRDAIREGLAPGMRNVRVRVRTK